MAGLLKKGVLRPLTNVLGAARIKHAFSKPPVLVGGCARSGTTLLLSMIDAHPEIHGVPFETGAFASWKKATLTKEFVPKRIDPFYRYFLTHRVPSTVTRWCEKTPTNVRCIDKIFDYFDGQAQFVHIIRDGRDVLTSRFPEKPDEYWVSPARWVNDVRAGLAYREHDRVITVRYEDLVRAPSESIRGIIENLGHEYTPEMERWVEHTGVRESESSRVASAARTLSSSVLGSTQ